MDACFLGVFLTCFIAMMGDSAAVADAGFVLCGSVLEGSPSNVWPLNNVRKREYLLACIYWSIND